MEHLKNRSTPPAPRENFPLTGSTEDFFPTRFDFFNFGRIESMPRSCELSEIGHSPLIVLFQVRGDETGLCAVGFDSLIEEAAQDASMLVEMANILVSKFANHLADSTGAMVELSPPEILQPNENRHRHLLTGFQRAPAGSTRVKGYQYVTESSSHMTLRLVYLPASHGEA